jgi:hypothetical protein
MKLGKEFWAIIYCIDDYENANTVINMMRKCSGSLGIEIGDP